MERKSVTPGDRRVVTREPPSAGPPPRQAVKRSDMRQARAQVGQVVDLDDQTPASSSPHAVMAYLAALKPLQDAAFPVVTAWMQALHRLRQSTESPAARNDAMRAGVLAVRQLEEVQRRLAATPVPPSGRELHLALQTWLRDVAASSAIVVAAGVALTPQKVEAARDRMRVATRAADAFNAERARLMASIQEDDDDDRGSGSFAGQRKRKIIIASVLVGLLALALVVWTLTTVRESAIQQASGANRRVYTRTEILAKLDEEIVRRNVTFLEPDIQLAEPDQVTVSGRIPASELPVPELVLGETDLMDVSVELRIGVEDGRPTIVPVTISAAGMSVPAWPFEALTKRATEGNQELAAQLAPTEILRRAYVEGDTIVAEFDPITPPVP